jgi:hypothetical protein
MTKPKVWKVRAADLRRIAATAKEPERERKMLVLAEQLEEEERRDAGDDGDTSGRPLRRRRAKG